MKEEKSYGVIIILHKENEEDRILLLKHIDGHWGVPKGHKEEGETDLQTALRELKEETGITEVEISNLLPIFEEYIYERNGQKYHKTNEYLIGFVKSGKVAVQEKEICEYKWATFEEALGTFTYEVSKRTLEKIKSCLENMVK